MNSTLLLLLPLLLLPPLLGAEEERILIPVRANYDEEARQTLGPVLDQIEDGIQAQRDAGHPAYAPRFVYVVDPREQRLHVLSRVGENIALTLPVGTGSAGVGFGDRQTPPGFWVMGGVRIAKDGSASIQTGDTKTGVSGVYAEMLYPPAHEDISKRGTVPNNVIIHSFNPAVSEMLRQRYARGLIGKEPCTTGCPVVHPNDTRKLIPFFTESAGPFDPGANPNAALQKLIRRGKVKEYESPGLGDPIYIIDPSS